MKICLSGYYYAGSRGDELLRKIITKDLGQFGKVKGIYCESKNYKSIIDWCDVLVVGGGSLITPRGIGGYSQIKYAKHKKKKIMFYANTIEDGHPEFHDCMRCADAITVRDSASFSLCNSYGYKCTLSADPAIKTARKRIIHIGVRKWVTEPKKFENRLTCLLNGLAGQYTLIFTPYTLRHTDTISDLKFSRNIMKKMHKKIKIKKFKEDAGPDLFIGMRLHSVMSAIKRMIPTIAINYNRKIENFMRDINKEKFLVGYNRIEEIPGIIKKIFLKEIIEREKKNIEVFRRLMRC
jgi:polysaccharide pyruvyl transferase WcaK-like protein